MIISERHRLATLPIPVIAAVNGPAIGAGTQLAIACDLRVAGPTARFAVPTAKLGLAVDPWSVRRLASLAGGGSARAMLLGSTPWTPGEPTRSAWSTASVTWTTCWPGPSRSRPWPRSPCGTTSSP